MYIVLVAKHVDIGLGMARSVMAFASNKPSQQINVYVFNESQTALQCFQGQ